MIHYLHVYHSLVYWLVIFLLVNIYISISKIKGLPCCRVVYVVGFDPCLVGSNPGNVDLQSLYVPFDVSSSGAEHWTRKTMIYNTETNVINSNIIPIANFYYDTLNYQRHLHILKQQFNNTRIITNATV